MPSFSKDLALAVRSLRKNPGFALTAVVTLALGIGASTAIFSVVNAVLLEPLPYRDPERLAIIWNDLRNRNVQNYPVSSGDYLDLKEAGKDVFAGVAAVQTFRVAMTDLPDQPEMARIAFATHDIFSVLGVQPVIGRSFVESDATPNTPPPAPPPGAAQPAAPPPAPTPNSMILSHEYWQRRYGGDSAVVGRSVPVGNTRWLIVGVLQPGVELSFPPSVQIERYPDAWVAMRADFATANRGVHNLNVIARLKDGATFAAASAQADRLAADLRERFTLKNTAGLHYRVEPMHLDVVRNVQRPLWLLLGAVGFVLLIACANIANLLLVRASSRERELVVRAALGGSRWMLVRQMLAESLVLAGVGAVAGLLLAQSGIDVLTAVAPASLPRMDGVRIDVLVLAFCVALSLISAVTFGLVPAMRASRPNVADALRAGRAASQSGGRVLRNMVVVAEVALSFVLLVGSGLMLRTFFTVARTDIGYDPEGVLTFQLSNTRLNTQEAFQGFIRQVRERISAIPGVTAVASSNSLPLDGSNPSARWVPESQSHDERAFRQGQYFFVHPDYFKAMGTQLVAGRQLTEADIPVQPQIPPGTPPEQADAIFTAFLQKPRPAVVDEKLAKIAFPNESPIGKRIMGRLGGPNVMTPFEIVGVVRHQRHTSLTEDEREMVFLPQHSLNRWVVRTSGSTAGLLPQIRTAIASVDPLVPMAEVRPMREYVDRALAPTRFVLVLLAAFAAIAAVLASVGLYGVLASAVRQRTAEIGVRMAFGAPSRSIFRMVIGQGLRLSAAGVVIGAVGAVLLTGAMRTLLVGVSATDPMTFASIVALFLMVATLACWLPARRAAALDPNVALREE
jgi:putative ABC transport system permease protein